MLSYALPLMVGLGVTKVVKDWKLGYFAYIAKEVSSLPLHKTLISNLHSQIKDKELYYAAVDDDNGITLLTVNEICYHYDNWVQCSDIVILS